MKYTLLALFLILGSIAYGYTEGTKAFWYVGYFYGVGTSLFMLWFSQDK